MIAGLPNDIRKITLFVLVSTIIFVFALPGLAEDVQTPSTTLDDVLTLVTQNDYLSPTQQTLLTSSLTSAVTSGALTVDQALALVDLSGLEDVTDATETPVVTHALSIILDALASGEISPEQASTYIADTVESGTLSALKDLTETETPMGIEYSISKLGTTEGYDQEALDTVLVKVDELVAAGVPSGIALRVAKDLLRAGLDPDEIVTELNNLETSIAEEGTSPGKAANAVTSQGQNKNQNQEKEMNQNTNQGKNDKPENEDEENQNGSSGNSKSSGSPENENSNNSTNGSAGNGNNGGNGSNADAGTSPGKAANEVAPEGQNQEEEVNQNTNQGKNDEPENEDEENQNGSSGNGKSSTSSGKGNADKGSNGSSGSGNNGGNGSNGNSGNAGTKGGKG